MKSIQRTLVLWLIGGLMLGIAAVLGTTYFFARAQLSSIFDTELKQIANAVHLREDWIEAGRLRIGRPGFDFSIRAYDDSGRVYFETALPSLPSDAPQLFDEGFSSMETESGEWRIYTHVAPEGIVQVAQPEALRAGLARELSLRMAMPTMLLIPVLAGMVALVLRRGLAPLQQTSRRVSDRDATRLDALPIQDVPLELLPLIQQLNALLARLAASLETQRRFIAEAAHELRSPVAALALQAQVAHRAQRPEARDAAFTELETGIARAARLVEQLLDLARLEPGVRQPLRAVDVAQLAREAVGTYAVRAEALGVDLGADAPGPASMVGAEPELRSLINNLVDNALRYAPAQSEVTVTVRRHTSVIQLLVVDAGSGIPPGERERVFERFQRVSGDLTIGSGLGLPIAKAIVERHGGSITLEDAQPGGTPPGLAVRVTLAVGEDRRLVQT